MRMKQLQASIALLTAGLLMQITIVSCDTVLIQCLSGMYVLVVLYNVYLTSVNILYPIP